MNHNTNTATENNKRKYHETSIVRTTDTSSTATTTPARNGLKQQLQRTNQESHQNGQVNNTARTTAAAARTPPPPPAGQPPQQQPAQPRPSPPVSSAVPATNTSEPATKQASDEARPPAEVTVNQTNGTNCVASTKPTTKKRHSIMLPIDSDNNNNKTSTANHTNNDMDISSEEDEGIANENPKISGTRIVLMFQNDTMGKPTAFSCYHNPRPAVRCEFSRHGATSNMISQTRKRLARWEPFWKVTENLAVGMTSPVIRRHFPVDPNRTADTPNTVASFTLLDQLSVIKLNLQNSNPNDAPKDGEYRLLLRMLPLTLSDYQKKKRSDCHIWPTGTFLQIEQKIRGRNVTQPLRLAQRVQQSHDLKEWKGICKHLDLTSNVKVLDSSAQLGFEICCHDTQQYMYSLDICKYQSPKLLTKQLLSPGKPELKRLSIEASFAKALHMMKNSVVSLGDSNLKDVIDDTEMRHITFSLQDPVTRSPIITPVRGRRCRHFSVSEFPVMKFVEAICII